MNRTIAKHIIRFSAALLFALFGSPRVLPPVASADHGGRHPGRHEDPGVETAGSRCLDRAQSAGPKLARWILPARRWWRHSRNWLCRPCRPSCGGARGDVHGGYACVRLPLGMEEHVYGLGMRADGDVNLRSKSYQLRVTPASHAPTPFYISRCWLRRGDQCRPGTVTSRSGSAIARTAPTIRPSLIGTRTASGRRGRSRMPSRPTWLAPGMEVLLFVGKNPLEVVRRYNLYCGGGCLPARWGLGFWHRVHTKTTADRAIAEVEEFAKRDIPFGRDRARTGLDECLLTRVPMNGIPLGFPIRGRF